MLPAAWSEGNVIGEVAEGWWITPKSFMSSVGRINNYSISNSDVNKGSKSQCLHSIFSNQIGAGQYLNAVPEGKKYQISIWAKAQFGVPARVVLMLLRQNPNPAVRINAAFTLLNTETWVTLKGGPVTLPLTPAAGGAAQYSFIFYLTTPNAKVCFDDASFAEIVDGKQGYKHMNVQTARLLKFKLLGNESVSKAVCQNVVNVALIFS